MIIFLYGEDNFRSQEKLNEIKKKFLEKNSSGSGLSLFDFSEKKEKIDWLSLAGSRDLFSPKRLIIMKSLITDSGIENQGETIKFLKSDKKVIEDKDLVIVFWERGKLKENSILPKLILSNSRHQRFDLLDGRKLAAWINSRLKSFNPDLSISSSALEKLMAYVGNNLFQMDNEIGKLANFKEAGIIEEKDVDLLVKAKIDANIFDTLDAASSGDRKKALALLHDQLEKGDDPFYILSMYVYQFRNLLKIGEYFEQGLRNQYEIAKLAKLHPFVVQKGMTQLNNYDLEKIKEIYKKLEEVDSASKTGKTDIKLALDKFVAGI